MSVGNGAGNDLALKQVSDLYSTLNLAYHRAVNETNEAHDGEFKDNHPTEFVHLAPPMVQTFTRDDGTPSDRQNNVPKNTADYAKNP